MVRSGDHLPPYLLAQKCGLDTPHDIPRGHRATDGILRRHRATLLHEISSRPATDAEHRQFDLAPGMSTLVYHRGLVDDTPVRYTRELVPADRNVITHVKTSRTSTGP